MNSIFKLITNQQIPETANALVPVIGYEPWSLRALESIKSSIVNGVPTLIRVHSAADYPIEMKNSLIAWIWSLIVSLLLGIMTTKRNLIS